MKVESTKRRVAIFRRDLLPISETFIRDQALALERWHPVLAGRGRVSDGLPLGDLDTCVVRPSVLRLERASDDARSWLNRPIPRMVDTFQSLNVDLVHAHFGTDATILWPSIRAIGLPMLVTLHGYDITTRREWWQCGGAGARWKSYPRRLLKMAQDPRVHFIAVSRAIRDRAVAFGIPESKITLRYTGVDIRRFRPGGPAISKRPRRILFVGRMVEKKAPLLLVSAFAQVRTAVPDAELMFVGGGPLLGGAQRLAKALGVPVEFAGPRSPDEVLARMHDARVLCLPSVTAANGDAEGFGMVLLEAQACGVPVVTSALGGATEGIVDGETGFAFPEGDAASLSDKLAKVLTDDALCTRMSLAAARFVADRFDVSKLARLLETTYDKAVLRHGHEVER